MGIKASSRGLARWSTSASALKFNLAAAERVSTVLNGVRISLDGRVLPAIRAIRSKRKDRGPCLPVPRPANALSGRRARADDTGLWMGTADDRQQYGENYDSHSAFIVRLVGEGRSKSPPH